MSSRGGPARYRRPPTPQDEAAKQARRDRRPAEQLPVARVAVDSPLPHLDRPFDYLVPAELDDAVQPGSRVRVRFAGRLLDAWVLHRLAATEHDGRLAYLERSLGEQPVLTPETEKLFRTVADRWAGTFADVVRLAVPPRHARAEATVAPEPAESPAAPNAEAWSRYRAGGAFLAALATDRHPRAVWNALPGEDWPARLAEAARAVLAVGRGVLIVVPDARDAARVDAAMTAALPKGSHVLLSADSGPETRYRRWLAVRRGVVRAVVGTRSAVFAPVADLGLIAIWDDGDDLLAEPRAPYPHARDVAVLRTQLGGSALLVGGFARTAESALLVQSGWAAEIVADRAVLRAAAPRTVATGDDFELERDPAARSARLPALAFRAAREALAAGRPVLVQSPRKGYLPTLLCSVDRSPARCLHCSGPLGVDSHSSAPRCMWCGRPATGWECPHCHSSKPMRAGSVIGSARTAEELGRAFAGVVTRASSGEQVLAEIPPGPSIVVATPGAEPTVEGGYGAALLLDGWALLGRPDLRAAEETLRRWCNAAAMVTASGTVVIGADESLAPVQALIRWDPAGHANRELADRTELNFPPVSRLAALTGAPADIAELLSLTQLPPSAEELGTVPVARGTQDTEQVRSLVRVSRPEGIVLAEALHAAAAVRSAKKSGATVRIMLDPLELF